MNNNFTAQELITLHKNAVDTFKGIVDSINAVKDASQQMSNVVKSEDSNLAGAWDNIAQSIVEPVKKAESSFEYIGNALNNYVQKTVANEQSAESDLTKVDVELGRLGQIAGGLVDLGVAVGGDTQAIPGPTAGGDTPSVIYAPPTPSDSEQAPPSVIYAPPTPSMSGMSPNNGGTGIGAIGGISAANTPSVIYAPPTPSGSAPSGPSVIYAPPTPSVSGINNNQ